MSIDMYQQIVRQVQQLTPDEQKRLTDFVKQVEQLTPDERQKLVEEMIAMSHPQPSRKPKHRIMELKGLGKEIWEGIDPQQYIEEERNSWDG